MFKKRSRQIYFLIFVLPTLLAFIIGFIYPFFQGIYLSFCKFRTTSNATWVGFDNFKVVLGCDSTIGNTFWPVLGWTLVWAVLALVRQFRAFPAARIAVFTLAVSFAVLSCVNVNQRIVEFNLWQYEQGYVQRLDTDVLRSLGWQG